MQRQTLSSLNLGSSQIADQGPNLFVDGENLQINIDSPVPATINHLILQLTYFRLLLFILSEKFAWA